jgi:hypothetical protein
MEQIMDQHRILVGDCIDMMRTLPDQSVTPASPAVLP